MLANTQAYDDLSRSILSDFINVCLMKVSGIPSKKSWSSGHLQSQLAWRMISSGLLWGYTNSLFTWLQKLWLLLLVVSILWWQYGRASSTNFSDLHFDSILCNFVMYDIFSLPFTHQKTCVQNFIAPNNRFISDWHSSGFQGICYLSRHLQIYRLWNTKNAWELITPLM